MAGQDHLRRGDRPVHEGAAARCLDRPGNDLLSVGDHLHEGVGAIDHGLRRNGSGSMQGYIYIHFEKRNFPPVHYRR